MSQVPESNRVQVSFQTLHTTTVKLENLRPIPTGPAMTLKRAANLVIKKPINRCVNTVLNISIIFVFLNLTM